MDFGELELLPRATLRELRTAGAVIECSNWALHRGGVVQIANLKDGRKVVAFDDPAALNAEQQAEIVRIVEAAATAPKPPVFEIPQRKKKERP